MPLLKMLHSYIKFQSMLPLHAWPLLTAVHKQRLQVYNQCFFLSRCIIPLVTLYQTSVHNIHFRRDGVWPTFSIHQIQNTACTSWQYTYFSHISRAIVHIIYTGILCRSSRGQLYSNHGLEETFQFQTSSNIKGLYYAEKVGTSFFSCPCCVVS